MNNEEIRCINCRFCHRLKYHFEVGSRFKEGFCCDALLRLPDGNDETMELTVNGPWIQEVTPDDYCEMFSKKVIE